jgi:hypothetical protein
MLLENYQNKDIAKAKEVSLFSTCVYLVSWYETDAIAIALELDSEMKKITSTRASGTPAPRTMHPLSRPTSPQRPESLGSLPP